MKVGDVYYDTEEKEMITIEKIENKSVFFKGYTKLGYIERYGLVSFSINFTIERILNKELLKQNGIDYGI